MNKIILPTLLVCFLCCGCIQPNNNNEDASKVVAVITEDQHALFDEGGGGSFNLMGYDSIDFGQFGKRIINKQDPQDMHVLRACLLITDEPRTIVVEKGDSLPVRRCDYALFITEEILMQRNATQTHRYSFGPRTNYEYRDAARGRALKHLFGIEDQVESIQYIYLNKQGNDISEYRRSPLMTIGYP